MKGTFKKIYCIALIVIMQQMDGFSQNFEFRFRHITNREGLANSMVNDICKDSLGFMWFASFGGLHRYDGYEMKVFMHDPADSSTIPQNDVRSMYIDREQRMWLAFSKPGISYYDILKDEFVNFFHSNENRHSIYDAAVNCIFQDSGGKIWIGTDKGLCFYNQDEGNIVRLDSIMKASDIPSFSVRSIFESSNGLIWFLSNHQIQSGQGICIYAPGENRFYRLHSDKNPNLPTNAVTHILEDNENNIWIGTNGQGAIRLQEGYNLSQIGEWRFKTYLDYHYSHPYSQRSRIIHIYETSRGDLWFSTNLGLALLRNESIPAKNFEFFLFERSSSLGDNPIKKVVEDGFGNIWAIPDALNIGLFRYHYEDENYQLFKNGKYNHFSVSGNKYDDIFIDNRDIIWLATDNNGVDILDLHQKKFHTFRSDLGIGSTLSSDKVFGMDEDKEGNIWIASYNGLNKLDPQTNRILHYNNSWRSDFFNQNEMFEVYCDHDNKLWIGYIRVLMSCFDPEILTNRKFLGSDGELSSFRGWSVRVIMEDKEGNLWIGTKGSGLWKYMREMDEFHVYLPTQDENSISGDEIFDLYEDPDGNLWIATNSSGLSMLDPETESFINYSYDPDDSSSLQDDQLLCIAANDSRIIWLGTVSKGLVKFDRSSQKFENYTTDDGLCNNMVKGILFDEEGKLWLSTNNGLSNFDPVGNSFTNYTVDDGIQGNEFNILSYFKASNGTMYFGGTSGLTVFHPSKIEANPHEAKPVISELKLYNRLVKPGRSYNDQLILDKTLLYTDRLKLNHKNKVFSIAYTALNYSAPQKTCYHYKLEGFDPEWNIDKTGSRQATYTNLDPGEYIFKLKATNNDGVLGDITRELHITIQPAWWETGLFKFILGSTLLLIAFLLFRMRTRQLKKQKDTLKEKVERRTEELRKKNQVLTERQNELLEKNEEIGKMSEKIQDLNQARLRFYTNVSHEIRTPLTLMITPTQKLLQTSPETPISNVRSSIEMIDKNEKRLLQLINQLLEIRKIETGKLRLNLQTGDLMQELEEIAILFQQAAAECKIDYSFHFTKSDDKGAEIVYDRDKLEKIAFNLISNAFKFTRKGDKVEVSASLTDQILQFNVSDTGVGIKPDMIDKIFDRFSSQSPENEHFSNSSGIGLAYVKELVEIHKGQIEVKSQNGKSTEFKVRISVSRQAYPGEHFSETSYYRRSERTVDLPQRLEVDREDQNADAPGFRHNSPVNHSLLIVEDNTELQRLLAEHLRKFFKIRKASDGVEGKQIVLQNKPDIILCDIMMPRMNGMELCKELKSKIETSHIPIVLLTAKSNQEDQLSGISEGADDYIVKPFDLNLLTAKLLNLVKIRDRLKERFGQETTLLPESLGSNEMDESFLREVVDFIRNNIQDNELNAERIAKELRVSRSFVYQKISALSGNTVNEFIRIIRLKVACELMKNPALSLSEIAYTSGFTSLNYFSRSFKQQFKQLPSEYRKSLSPKE